MARRTRRSDMPHDPAGTLRALAACRKAMLDVSRAVKPMGPADHAASMVIAAIDGMAAFLTGERYYFSIGGSTPQDRGRGETAPIGPVEGDPPCP